MLNYLQWNLLNFMFEGIRLSPHQIVNIHLLQKELYLEIFSGLDSDKLIPVCLCWLWF